MKPISGRLFKEEVSRVRIDLVLDFSPSPWEGRKPSGQTTPRAFGPARARGHADAHASGGDGWGNTGGGNSFLRSSMGNTKDLPKIRQEDNPRAIGRCHHDMFGVPLANTLLLHDNPEGEESGPDTSSTGGKRILRGVSIGRRES